MNLNKSQNHASSSDIPKSTQRTTLKTQIKRFIQNFDFSIDPDITIAELRNYFEHMNKVTLNNEGRVEFNSLLKSYLPMFSKYAMKQKPITIKELENNNSTKSSTSNEGDNKLKSVKVEENVDVPTTSGFQQIL